MEFVESIQADVRWLGFDWGEHLYFASDYFEQLYAVRARAGPARQGLRLRPLVRGDRRAARHADRARHPEPVPRALGRREPRPLPAHEGGRLPARRARAAREDRHGVAGAADARPDPLPDLGARCRTTAPDDAGASTRCTTSRTASRTRSSASPTRSARSSSPTTGRSTSGCSTRSRSRARARADRVRAREPVAHRGQQARAAPARRGGPRARLGRPAHADARRACAGAGYPPAAIRRFWGEVGVAKRENLIELARLEAAVRDELNRTAPRAMAVLRPLKVVLVNYPEDQSEELEALNNPEDPSAGTRKRAVLARALDRARRLRRRSAAEVPPARARRARCGCASPTSSRCEDVVKDARGEVVEVRCSYDPATRGGDAPDGRKVKGTIHWVSARHAVVRGGAALRHALQRSRTRSRHEGRDFTEFLNPESLEVVAGRLARAEPRERRRRQPLPVRAARLLLRRPRLDARSRWS